MQIGEVLSGGARRQRDVFDQLEPEAVEATHLSRVVREQADAAHAEVQQELCADSVFAVSTGKPSSRFASTVSRPLSWRL